MIIAPVPSRSSLLLTPLILDDDIIGVDTALRFDPIAAPIAALQDRSRE
jgi:hypothetical protein